MMDLIGLELDSLEIAGLEIDEAKENLSQLVSKLNTKKDESSQSETIKSCSNNFDSNQYCTRLEFLKAALEHSS